MLKLILFLRSMKNQTMLLFIEKNPEILFSSVYGFFAAFLFGRRAVKEILTKQTGVEDVFRLLCNFHEDWEVKLFTLERERKHLQQGNSGSSLNWEQLRAASAGRVTPHDCGDTNFISGALKKHMLMFCEGGWLWNVLWNENLCHCLNRTCVCSVS